MAHLVSHVLHHQRETLLTIVPVEMGTMTMEEPLVLRVPINVPLVQVELAVPHVLQLLQEILLIIVLAKINFTNRELQFALTVFQNVLPAIIVLLV
jgi:hypothetical protein